MAENAAASRHRELRPLSQVNQEPGGQTISTVVRILNTIMRPLTKGLEAPGQGAADRRSHLRRQPHLQRRSLAVGQFLAFSGRWPRILAKASVFEIPVVGRIIAASGQIPVQRDSAQSKDALIAAAQAIEQDGRW